MPARSIRSRCTASAAIGRRPPGWWSARRYGYFFNNNEQRGIPEGTRYRLSEQRSTPRARIWPAQPFPTSSFNTSGFANIPNNLATHLRCLQAQELQRRRLVLRRPLRRNPHVQGRLLLARRSPTTCCATSNGGAVNLFWGTQLLAGDQHHGLRRDQRAELADYGKSGLPGPVRILRRRHRRDQHRRRRHRPRRRSTSRMPGR